MPVEEFYLRYKQKHYVLHDKEMYVTEHISCGVVVTKEMENIRL
jgi:hypothetical protein